MCKNLGIRKLKRILYKNVYERYLNHADIVVCDHENGLFTIEPTKCQDDWIICFGENDLNDKLKAFINYKEEE